MQKVFENLKIYHLQHVYINISLKNSKEQQVWLLLSKNYKKLNNYVSITDIERLSSDKTDYEDQLESMDIRLGSLGATKEENKSKIIKLIIINVNYAGIIQKAQKHKIPYFYNILFNQKNSNFS